jgi:hypothetical protein
MPHADTAPRGPSELGGRARLYHLKNRGLKAHALER